MKYDEAALLKLSKSRHDIKQYIAFVREEIDYQEELLRSDIKFSPNQNDHAGDSQQPRETLNK